MQSPHLPSVSADMHVKSTFASPAAAVFLLCVCLPRPECILLYWRDVLSPANQLASCRPSDVGAKTITDSFKAQRGTTVPQ